LVSGSPPSRGRCLDPGSRPPQADLAGMTTCDRVSGKEGKQIVIMRIEINNRYLD
jgi:hypothetical protein